MEPVHGDGEQPLNLRGIGRRDLGDPADEVQEVVDVNVVSHVTCPLGALEERAAGRIQRRSAVPEDVGVRAGVREQLGVRTTAAPPDAQVRESDYVMNPAAPRTRRTRAGRTARTSLP